MPRVHYAMAQRLNRIRDMLEQQPIHLSATAWVIASVTPACEMSQVVLGFFDAAVDRASIKRVVAKAMQKGGRHGK